MFSGVWQRTIITEILHGGTVVAALCTASGMGFGVEEARVDCYTTSAKCSDNQVRGRCARLGAVIIYEKGLEVSRRVEVVLASCQPYTVSGIPSLLIRWNHTQDDSSVCSAISG